jgi:hypothetical protein
MQRYVVIVALRHVTRIWELSTMTGIAKTLRFGAGAIAALALSGFGMTPAPAMPTCSFDLTSGR